MDEVFGGPSASDLIGKAFVENEDRMAMTVWPLIELDSCGIAQIEGTTTKVIEIALDRIAHHWDADEIRRQHPHLTLGQIHAALAYYYEHQEECDRLIDERRSKADQIRKNSEDRVLQDRLRHLSRT